MLEEKLKEFRLQQDRNLESFIENYARECVKDCREQVYIIIMSTLKETEAKKLLKALDTHLYVIF